MADLSVGDIAPEFTLPSDAHGDISLSDYRGRTVVIYFYPRDSTPGCTKQACEFRDHREAFSDKGAAVLGVSKDSLKSHGNFRAKYDLNFPLLSDPDLEVHKAYGAYGKKMNYGKTYMGVIRTTVTIDPEGRISSYNRNVKAAGNAERTLKSL